MPQPTEINKFIFGQPLSLTRSNRRGTDPYARWWGRGGTARCPPIPITGTKRGLGRYIIAARIHCDADAWLTLTWPGYTGVLQAISPGRFAAAVNQAPMEQH